MQTEQEDLKQAAIRFKNALYNLTAALLVVLAQRAERLKDKLTKDNYTGE